MWEWSMLQTDLSERSKHKVNKAEEAKAVDIFNLPPLQTYVCGSLAWIEIVFPFSQVFEKTTAHIRVHSAWSWMLFG